MEFDVSGLGKSNRVFSIGSPYDRRTCNGCEFTDGLVYISNPPQFECTFTHEFHNGDYICPFKFAPVIKGKWKQIKCWATKAKYQCSVCGRTIMSAVKVNIEKYPYCHCGAKMSEE